MHWSEALDFIESRYPEYVPESGKKPKNGYARGFILPNGLQIGIETNTQGVRANIWIEDCGPPPVPSQFQLYKEDKSRTSALNSVAPRLSGPGYGKPPQRAYKILVESSNELESLLSWYSGLNGNQEIQSTAGKFLPVSNDNNISSSLNQILYGPPGTGKTFKTAQLAVEICDGQSPSDRDEVMARYEELRKAGRVSFVTFHQSYGYEDFVEGLRPEMNEGQVSYRVRPGLFRETCDAARRTTLVKPGLKGRPLRERTVFKMSLGESGTPEGHRVFQACMEQGLVLLGWGRGVDFSECNSPEDFQTKALEVNSPEKADSHARFVGVFKNEIQIGDIIIASNGNSAFQAIGEVTGPYECLEAPLAGRFHQARAVRWLAVYEGKRPVAEIYDRSFSQSSLYKLDPDGLKWDVLAELIQGEEVPQVQNFVLIIDEINRANISKVFGELITLLEPDKREGQANALTVKLPYSGEDFCVPSNLFIIGTMNTADRSIALLDTALRRRFSFEELQPDPAALPTTPIEGVVLPAMLQALNERIEYLYDRDHTVGHAYFMGVKTLEDLDTVFRRKVIPLLQEYFYEDWAKVKLALNDQNGGFIQLLQTVPKGLESFVDGYDPRPRYKVRDTHFPVDAFLSIYR